MLNFNWIKEFYALDKSVSIPSVRARYISLGIVGSIGLYAWMRYAHGGPMLFAVTLAFLMFFEPINFKFFKYVSIAFQIIFQTLRIIIMTILYYTVFALSAVYFRRKKLQGSSFVISNSSSLRKVDKVNIDWRKMW